jgi:glycosyltransferase involved in cell wall biosynthesis
MKTHKNILVTNSSTIYGGGEYFVLELSRSLHARGYNVVVGCKPDSLLIDKCRQAGLKVLPLDFPPQGQLLKYVRLLNRIIREHSIDLIHSNSNYDRTACGFAAWKNNIVHVANVHSFHSLQYNITHWIRNRFAVNRFIVDGFCVKEMMVKDDGIAAEKISVVHLGVNPDVMKRDIGLRNAVRKEFGVADTEIVIGNVARMVPFKGHEYMLKAFARIVPAAPAARLLLVGDGELTDGLQKLALELQVNDKVIFAGFRDDLVAMYSAFDIYAHSSIEGGGETFPFAVLQALSEELPVVVTRVGDVPYMVEECKNGFVTPDRDDKTLAKKLLLLVNNPEQRRAMAAYSREVLLKKFTIDKMVDQIEGIYEEVR